MEPKNAKRAADWERVVRGAQRIAFKRKLWAYLGHLLTEIKKQGREGN